MNGRWWITTGADGRGFLAYDNADDALSVLGKHEDSAQVVEVVPAEHAVALTAADRRFIESILLRSTAGPDRRYAETIVGKLAR